jgi:phage antirepressor YoqD-like protein
MTDDDILARGLLIENQRLLEAHHRITAAEAKIVALEPQALAHARLADSRGVFSETDAAKMLKVKRDHLFSFMERRDWISHKTGRWMAKQPQLDALTLDHRTITYRSGDGTDVTEACLVVTPHGLTRLSAMLNQQALDL